MITLLYSNHPLYELVFSLDVHEHWITEYFQFFFNLCTYGEIGEKDIINIQVDEKDISCCYNGSLLQTKFDIENITGKLTSWVNGIINDMLFMNHVYVLHGASCVYDSQTYLFLGSKGVGKSTLLYRMLAAGGQYLSDDNIYYSCPNTSIYYSGIGMRLKNQDPVDKDLFRLLDLKSSNIKYVQPKNINRSFSKPHKIFLLTKDNELKTQDIDFFEFLQVVLANLKNGNSGILDPQKIVKLYNIAEAKKINSFNISDINDLIG